MLVSSDSRQPGTHLSGCRTAFLCLLPPLNPPHTTPGKKPENQQEDKRAPTIKSKEGLKKKKSDQQQQQQEKSEKDDKSGLSKRDKELRDRKAYLKSFWYAAGRCIKCWRASS